jgi:hypothetical protein
MQSIPDEANYIVSPEASKVLMDLCKHFYERSLTAEKAPKN